MIKIRNRFKNRIFPAGVLTMAIVTMVIVVGIEMSIPFQFTFALTEEQNGLDIDEDGKTKSYSDCKGFADMMESAGVPKDQIGLNYDWVQARMLVMPNLISATSNETEKEKLQEEYDCLLAVREMNTSPETAKFCEELRQGTMGEVKCMFDDELSGAESIPSSVSSDSGEGGDNWIEYTNSDLDVSFEYPSDWDLKEKTGRFANDPEVMVGDGLNDFKFLGHDEAIDDMLDSFDLEFVASTMQSSALDAESNTRLVEGVTEFENVNIGGADGPIMTFLYTSTNPLVEGLDTNLQDIGEIARQFFLVENDDKVYTLGHSNYASDFDSPESQEIMHHILNTFQFIDSSSVSESEEENKDEDN